jgi:hypothetical protein
MAPGDPPSRFPLRSSGRGLCRRRHDLVGQEAARQIPALAKLEKEPKMKAVWKQGSISRDWSASYRGLSIRIKVDHETGMNNTASGDAGFVMGQSNTDLGRTDLNPRRLA